MIGPFLLLVGLVAGIFIGDAIGPSAAWAALSVAVVALVGAFIRRGAPGALAVAIIGACLLGVALEQRALHGLEDSPLARAVEHRRTADAVVTMAEDPDGPFYEAHALARVSNFAGESGGGRTVRLIASGGARSALRALDAGDRVRVRGALETLTGYDERFRWRHAVARFRVDEVLAIARPTSPWFQAANAARRTVLRGSAPLPGTERALLAGFLLGDTRAIPDDVVNDFRSAGLSHLLAVSGANVAFALAIVDPALRKLRRGPRFASGVGVLVLFGTMTRWEPSVLRAAVMAGLVMLARSLGRPADARRVLVLAIIGLLVVDPFLVRSVGFQLSCGACAGIVIGAAPIAARLRGPAWIREALGVTAAAQIGVSPVLLATFGTVPLVALPANLLAAPFVGPLTVWGLVASVAGGVLGPGATSWLQLPTLAMLRAIETIAQVGATEPVPVDGPLAFAMLVIAAVLAGLHRVRRGRADRLARRGRHLPREGHRSDPARS